MFKVVNLLVCETVIRNNKKIMVLLKRIVAPNAVGCAT